MSHSIRNRRTQRSALAMPVDAPAAPHSDETGLERLVFFSDAVFAIAITLLVLEIRLPGSIEGLSDQQLLDSLLTAWPRYLAYAISFLVIGGFWIGHHRGFSSIRSYNRRLISLNLLLLMAVAFIPFPTAVIAENGNRTGTIFYALSITLTGLLTAAEWIYASRAGLVDPRMLPRERNIVTWRMLLVPGVFLLSIPVAFFDPDIAKYAWMLTVPFAYLIRIRKMKQTP